MFDFRDFVLLMHHPAPNMRIDRDGRHASAFKIYEAAMELDFLMAEEPTEQGKRVECKSLVDKRFLLLQAFNRTAGRQFVLAIKERNEDFRKEIANPCLFVGLILENSFPFL